MMKLLQRSLQQRAAAQLCGSSLRLPQPAHRAPVDLGARSQTPLRRLAWAARSMQGAQFTVITQPLSNGDFLAPASVTFEGLGVSQELADSLARAGYSRPAHVQVRLGGSCRVWSCCV